MISNNSSPNGLGHDTSNFFEIVIKMCRIFESETVSDVAYTPICMLQERLRFNDYPFSDHPRCRLSGNFPNGTV